MILQTYNLFGMDDVKQKDWQDIVFCICNFSSHLGPLPCICSFVYTVCWLCYGPSALEITKRKIFTVSLLTLGLCILLNVVLLKSEESMERDLSTNSQKQSQSSPHQLFILISDSELCTELKGMWNCVFVCVCVRVCLYECVSAYARDRKSVV